MPTATSIAAHCTLLARYNEWATARLLDALHGVTDGAYRRDLGLFFKSIHGTLNHLLVGEHFILGQPCPELDLVYFLQAGQASAQALQTRNPQ